MNHKKVIYAVCAGVLAILLLAEIGHIHSHHAKLKTAATATK